MRSTLCREMSFDPKTGLRIPGWLASCLEALLTFFCNIADAQGKDDAATILQLTELRNADETSSDVIDRFHIIEESVPVDCLTWCGAQWLSPN